MKKKMRIMALAIVTMVFFCGIHALAVYDPFRRDYLCPECGGALQPVGTTSPWEDNKSHFEAGYGRCEYSVQYVDIDGKCPTHGTKWRGRCVTENHRCPQGKVYKYTGNYIN